MNIIKESKKILIEYKDIIFAYIFGSYVQNSIRSESDIDIVIYLNKNMDVESYLDLSYDKTIKRIKKEVELYNKDSQK